MAVLMTAKEISEELGISKTLAYQIMEKLNKELEAKGLEYQVLFDGKQPGCDYTDAAFKVAIDFAKGRTDTVVICAPDHDTGGMILPENMNKAVEELQLFFPSLEMNINKLCVLYKSAAVKPHFIPDDFCKLFQSKSPVIKCGNDNDSKLFQS